MCSTHARHNEMGKLPLKGDASQYSVTEVIKQSVPGTSKLALKWRTEDLFIGQFAFIVTKQSQLASINSDHCEFKDHLMKSPINFRGVKHKATVIFNTLKLTTILPPFSALTSSMFANGVYYMICATSFRSFPRHQTLTTCWRRRRCVVKQDEESWEFEPKLLVVIEHDVANSMSVYDS